MNEPLIGASVFLTQTPYAAVTDEDGRFVIEDIEELSAAAIDTIRFEAGILPGDVEILSVGPTDLVLGLVGTQDRLTIRNMFPKVMIFYVDVFCSWS